MINGAISVWFFNVLDELQVLFRLLSETSAENSSGTKIAEKSVFGLGMIYWIGQLLNQHQIHLENYCMTPGDLPSRFKG